ncbi:MAG: alpha/beta fold hydrolase [Cyclobacteriaceae bacterium]|nr:alpha/beta fold hydrolase [Cyclobacteriaceae bacterium]
MSYIYKPPFFLINGHVETIYPALFRNINFRPYQRERIITDDDDFLDLDWLTQNSSDLVIISHGLEGNTHRAYVRGMARALFLSGFDVLAWNYRGCSEEMNRQLRFYHSGATDDLDLVIRHALNKGYRSLRLVGFSLGGNLTLKYLGEKRERSAAIRQAIVFSVPLDLYTSCITISQPRNRIYALKFLISLKEKIRRKARFRKELDVKYLSRIKTLQEFDDRYTAPLHGFKNAREYYESCSSLHFVESIEVPTRIINARNDPFLSEACFPVNKLREHPHVRFFSPDRGGHVGFAQFNSNGVYWSELQAVEFFSA